LIARRPVVVWLYVTTVIITVDSSARAELAMLRIVVTPELLVASDKGLREFAKKTYFELLEGVRLNFSMR
jgi:hypothetical protein